MSQSYVIRVSASVSETVDAADKRTKSLQLTEIVPCDEQAEIIRNELRDRGWEEVEGSEGQVWEKTDGKVRQRIDLESMTHEAQVELQRTLERERTITVRGDKDFEDPDERRAKEEASLQRAIAVTDEERNEVHQTMQREIAETLDESEEARTEEVNEVIAAVYAESLKRKARRMGSVTEMRESQEGGEFELVIKLSE
jgi:FtsH ternary system-associated peptide